MKFRRIILKKLLLFLDRFGIVMAFGYGILRYVVSRNPHGEISSNLIVFVFIGILCVYLLGNYRQDKENVEKIKEDAISVRPLEKNLLYVLLALPILTLLFSPLGIVNYVRSDGNLPLATVVLSQFVVFFPVYALIVPMLLRKILGIQLKVVERNNKY